MTCTEQFDDGFERHRKNCTTETRRRREDTEKFSCARFRLRQGFGGQEHATDPPKLLRRRARATHFFSVFFFSVSSVSPW
jgi:hypothetical protein